MNGFTDADTRAQMTTALCGILKRSPAERPPMNNLIFADAECPNCGGICGNGGSGDIFYCPSCDWEGKFEMHPDDIKALDEIFREHMEKNREPAHEPK